MTRLRSALDRARDDDRGSSLVEVMIVLIMVTLILGATSSTMILGQRAAGSSSIRLDNSAQTRVGMESMSKHLRTAVLPSQLLVEGQACVGCGTTMVTSAAGMSITFYANINNDLAVASIGPSRVTYGVVQDPVRLWGNLVETVQAPTAGAPGQYTFCVPGPGCVVRSRVLSRGLVWPTPPVAPATPALFTYYDSTDAVLAAVPLNAADLGRIDSIDVTLRVRTSAAYQTPSTTVVQRIVLSNFYPA